MHHDSADLAARTLRGRLGEHGYVTDECSAVACSVALRLRRPLFLEGAPGTGKTSLATALAQVLDVPLIRLACHRGVDVTDALYSWDASRQLLCLRAAAGLRPGRAKLGDMRDRLRSREFLRPGPLLESLETTPCLLLVDDLDRGDEQLEAVMLQFLSDYAVTIPEFGTVRADTPPWVVLTSSRTRDVHDAVKRRCHYLWLDRPGTGQQAAIVRKRAPAVLAEVTARLRSGHAETAANAVDWSRAAALLGASADGTEAVALGRLLRAADRRD